MKLDYTVWGDSNLTGMGVHCRNMIKALMKQDKNIAFIPIQPINYQLIDNEYIATALNNRIYITGNEIAVMIKYADSCVRFIGRVRCAFAIFETDYIPEIERVYYRTLDIILVPSEWGKQVLINNGIDQYSFNPDKDINESIIVIPEGYDSEEYN
jgi:hypothetical protein